jgi:tight adherence protein B
VRWHRRRTGRLAVAVGRRPAQRASGFADAVRGLLSRLVDRWPRRTVVGCVGLATAVGWVAAGPVLAAVLALYGGAAAALALRHRRTVLHQRAETAAIDSVAELVGDLRAGASPAALALSGSGEPVAVAHGAVSVAVAVSERTGAPLADVLDRVETQLRQTQRMRRTADSHGAGTRATAFLLAILPIGGVGLGYVIGADPLALLFRTRFGGGCALIAVLLQLAGLVWSDRLARVDVA